MLSDGLSLRVSFYSLVSRKLCSMLYGMGHMTDKSRILRRSLAIEAFYVKSCTLPMKKFTQVVKRFNDVVRAMANDIYVVLL